MGNIESIQPYLEPLRRSVVVKRTPAEAFEIFTARFGSWWPYQRFSIHQQNVASCGLEPRQGGEVFEVARDGRRERWGTVVIWDPPGRLVLSWHPGHTPETAQQVELRFVAVPEGTRVDLEHRDWAKLGAAATETRESYENGWAVVLGQSYVEACS
jgi:hypothetical protein